VIMLLANNHYYDFYFISFSQRKYHNVIVVPRGHNKRYVFSYLTIAHTLYVIYIVTIFFSPEYI